MTEKQEQVAWMWHQAPVKTQWGHDMVVADLAIDKDHTVSIYCEKDQTAKVEVMFTPPAAQPAPVQEPDSGDSKDETIVQTFAGVAKRKLLYLLAGGWQVNGVAIARTEEDGTVRRGAVTTGGMVLWWNQTPAAPINSTTLMSSTSAAPVQEPDEWLTGCPECGMDSGCDCDSGTWNPPAAPVQEHEPENEPFVSLASVQSAERVEPVAQSLKDAVFTVLEGFTLPHDVRKILETAYYTTPPEGETA